MLLSGTDLQGIRNSLIMSCPEPNNLNCLWLGQWARIEVSRFDFIQEISARLHVVCFTREREAKVRCLLARCVWRSRGVFGVDTVRLALVRCVWRWLGAFGGDLVRLALVHKLLISHL